MRMIRPYRILRGGHGRAPHPCRGGRSRVRAGLVGLWVAVSVGLSSACHESLTQVDSRVVAPSTRPALDIAGSLPRLADLVAGEAPARSADTRDLTLDTRDLTLDMRGLAFDTTSIRSAIEAVSATITEVEGVALPLPPDLSGRLSEARSLLAEAESAQRAGDVTESVRWLLRSADALRRTTPRVVALGLVEKAEGALAARGVSSEPATPSHARAQRLTEWARSAVETGDYERAIQRAYYACRLLGVDLP